MSKKESKKASKEIKKKYLKKLQKRIKKLDVQDLSKGIFSSLLDGFEDLFNYLLVIGDFKGFRVNTNELGNLLNDSLQETKDSLSDTAEYDDYEVAGYYLVVKQINNELELQFQYLLCEKTLDQMSNFKASNIIESSSYDFQYHRIDLSHLIDSDDSISDVGDPLIFSISPNEGPMDMFGLGKSYISKVDLDILLSQNLNLFISLASIIPGELGYDYGSDISGQHIALKIEGDSYADVIFGAQPSGDTEGENLLPQFFITAPCPPYWDPEFSPGTGTPDATEFRLISNAGNLYPFDHVIHS